MEAIRLTSRIASYPAESNKRNGIRDIATQILSGFCLASMDAVRSPRKPAAVCLPSPRTPFSLFIGTRGFSAALFFGVKGVPGLRVRRDPLRRAEAAFAGQRRKGAGLYCLTPHMLSMRWMPSSKGYIAGHILFWPGYSAFTVSLNRAELVGGVEQYLVAMFLGDRQPKIRLLLVRNPQDTVGHFLSEMLPLFCVVGDFEVHERRQTLIRRRGKRLAARRSL